MRVGTTIICQNYGDWDRYEAAERGETAAAAPAIPDRQIFAEEVGHALLAGQGGVRPPVLQQDPLWLTPYAAPLLVGDAVPVSASQGPWRWSGDEASGCGMVLERGRSGRPCSMSR